MLAPVGLHEVVVDTDDAAAALSAFNADELVVSASVDFTRQIAGAATDPEYATQWALPQIGWEDVHGVASYAGNVSLAVLDTGVDAAAPDLAGRIGPGWSFDGSDPGTDPHGHGTHTATIAAASADDGVGIAGVAYVNTTVMPVKVLGANGTGTDSDVIAGLVWATDLGADVAVLTFAAAGYSAALQAAIDYAWANGVVLVAAAGNDGSTTPSYPAGSARVVGVGATAPDDSMWPASNQSDAVFLNAPGVNVLASDSSGTVGVTGTSASAAVTAGAAALLRAIDPGATNAMIVGRLARWADPITGPGNGRLDVGAASTDMSEDGATPLGAPEGGPIVSSYVAAVARTWTGAGGTNFNAAGSWSPAGVPTAADALTVPGAVASGNYPVINATSGSGLAA
ncbi:MAG: S8 family serine peptidase, partial [Acidimicrobiales bacterium]|nr:S8 family serine peptidase [Acidimicrobiales bacterium]